MSIFPDYAKRDAGGPPNKSVDDETKNKPHRFDRFAKRVAANLLDALRVTLTVFTSPDKERWPMARLISHLKGAEELARDMLREIAAKISVRPMIIRERRVSNAAPPEPSQERAPYFRLGVQSANTCRHPGLREAQDRDLLPQVAEVVAGGPPNKSADDEALHISSLQKRLAALHDVLAHPGKHAARMARALYRAEHGKGERLMALSPDDRLLENIIAAMAANASGDDAGLTQLHGEVMHLEPG